jgi:hypothetical protein
MDDVRIRQLTAEVLTQLRGAEPPRATDLEARVATLEAEVRELRAALQTATPVTSTVQVQTHPSLQALSVTKATEGCLLEPDKPCVGSGQCRSLGY